MEKSTFTPHYALLTKKVRELREKAGLTQRQFAHKLRRAQTMVARAEQGERRLDLIEFYWFCKTLKVDPKRAANEILDGCLALDKAGRKRSGKK